MNALQITSEQRDKIVAFLKSLNVDHVDIPYHVDIDELELSEPENVYEQIREQLEDGNAFDIEIIYYANAIEYLKENDCSLRESLGLAHDMGYEAKNLNSEILASILASSLERQNFSDCENEITEFFTELWEEIQPEETES